MPRREEWMNRMSAVLGHSDSDSHKCSNLALGPIRRAFIDYR